MPEGPNRRRPTRERPSKKLQDTIRALRLDASLRVGPPQPLRRAEPRPFEVDSASRRIGPPPVPHINQSRPAGAPTSYVDPGLCGPTCLAMVARAYGLGSRLTDHELVLRLSRIAGAVNGFGTDRVGLYRMARHLRLHSLDWDGEATFWMARQLELGRYVLAAGNPFVLPPFEKLEGYGGHFIVVDGMDASGNFLMKNPWPDGVHTVSPKQMHQFLLTDEKPYQYAFWR